VEWTGKAGEYLKRREYRYFSPGLRIDPDSRRPQELMNVALTNVPAIQGLSPLVAKWGGEALMPEGPQGEPAPGVAADKSEQDTMGWEAYKEKVTLAMELKSRYGLTPEAPESDLWQKSAEFLRDLAQGLGLPEEATATQLKGGLTALKAEESHRQTLEEELTALKARLNEETATRAVEEAMLAGKISPAQKDWALSYCRREPENFKVYVDKAPRVVPVGERLNLGEGEHRENQSLTPEELALCRVMNLTPEAYSQAKAIMVQAK